MSKFADENRTFIETVKELPKVIASIGYDPIDPRLINTRSGVFIAVLAMIRLPEISSSSDMLIFVTSKIGRDLTIDPYELLTPSDYRTVSGTRKLEYRTSADMRAYTMINKLINDCKSLNRELVNLNRQTDLPQKIDYLKQEAVLTFKRIVSLKEFTFGGAYLLDEDVYEQLSSFQKEIDQFSIISASSPQYHDLSSTYAEMVKQIQPHKRDSLNNETVKKYFYPVHEAVLAVNTHIQKAVSAKSKNVSYLRAAVQFIREFVQNIKKCDPSEFDGSVFAGMPTVLETVITAYETDLDSLEKIRREMSDQYLNSVPPAIVQRSPINTSYLLQTAQKTVSSTERYLKELDRFLVFSSAAEFSRTNASIRDFYHGLAKSMDNRSFKESVGRSFKFKKMLKLPGK